MQREKTVTLEALDPRRLFSAGGANLLFIGNSFTFYNNLPDLVGDIATAAGQPAPNIFSQTLAGQTLTDHLNKIKADGANNVIDHSLPTGADWNDVIVQDLSTRPVDVTTPPVNGDPAGFRRDVASLFSHVKINSPAAHAVLYETWARGGLNPLYPSGFADPGVMQSQLLSNYTLAENDLNDSYGAGTASVAPVGEAWKALGWPQNLYSGTDEYHPSPRGSMLAALVLYSTIYHDNPSRIAATAVQADLTALGLNAGDWQQLTTLADTNVSTISKTKTTLQAVATGAPAGGSLSYRWSPVGDPAAGATRIFPGPDSDAASTIVRFARAGRYEFRCTISDSAGFVETNDVTINVRETPTSLSVTPAAPHIHPRRHIAFHASILDQFGHAMPAQTSGLVHYTLLQGRGGINRATGAFTASSHTGKVRIEVTGGGFEQTLWVLVE